MTTTTIYFENPGAANTGAVFDIVKKRARKLGIKTVLVASTTGATAVQAVEALRGFNMIVVTHSQGLVEPDTQEFTVKNRELVLKKKGIIYTGTHVLGGLNRALRQGLIPEARSAYNIGDIVTQTLRTFGQGMKVACEITAMAADAGLVRTDEEVIAIAGTGAGNGGRGADTAVVIKPGNSNAFFDTEVREILCKPRYPNRL